MKYSINLYSEHTGEINKFLKIYYSREIQTEHDLSYTQFYDNPIDFIDIICCIIDNNSKFRISIWISLDKDVFISVNTDNLNKIIKYIYERFPL